MLKLKLTKDITFPDTKPIKKGSIVNVFKSQYDDEYVISYKDSTLCSLLEAVLEGYITNDNNNLDKYLPKDF